MRLKSKILKLCMVCVAAMAMLNIGTKAVYKNKKLTHNALIVRPNKVKKVTDYKDLVPAVKITRQDIKFIPAPKLKNLNHMVKIKREMILADIENYKGNFKRAESDAYKKFPLIGEANIQQRYDICYVTFDRLKELILSVVSIKQINISPVVLLDKDCAYKFIQHNLADFEDVGGKQGWFNKRYGFSSLIFYYP